MSLAFGTKRRARVSAERRLVGLLALMTLSSMLCSMHAYSQPFDFPKHPHLSTLHASGRLAESLDIVITGDGYSADDELLFLQQAQSLSDGLLSFGPYAESQGLINTHALFIPSIDRGADHPSQGLDVQTAFDATYESYGISYLITADEAKVLSAVAKALPAFDLAVLLINDPAYGGSGGEVAMVSRAPESIAILRHELGHTLAGLADEYEQPNPSAAYMDPEPNVATTAHISPPPWEAWIDGDTPVPTPLAMADGPYSPVGAYEGARYRAKDMFRPAPNCLMRSLDREFCPVCHEAMLKALARESQMLRGRTPDQAELSCVQGQAPTFSLTMAAVAPLSIIWRRDGVVVGSGASWSPQTLSLGKHLITAKARHRSPRVRFDPQQEMIEQTSWIVRVHAKESAAPASPDPNDPVQLSDPDQASDPVQPSACAAAKTPGNSIPILWGLGWAILAIVSRRRVRRVRCTWV